MNDLFFGNDVNLVVSFISDATILGVVNSLSSFNATLSNPWSINGISDPPELVPETVLTVADTVEPSPGVITSNTGVSLLNCIFLDPLTSGPPIWFSSVKLGISSGFVTSPLSIWMWYLTTSLSDINKVLNIEDPIYSYKAIKNKKDLFEKIIFWLYWSYDSFSLIWFNFFDHNLEKIKVYEKYSKYWKVWQNLAKFCSLNINAIEMNSSNYP